jgi:3-methyladenine DNA glycosylase AlkD
MTAVEVHSIIRALLVERGDRATAEAQERYMKGVVRFHGLKTPVLRALLKENAVLWKPLSDEAKIELSWLLLRSEWFEEKDWGISILKTVKALDESWLARLEAEFDGIVNGWATCDGLCGSVLRSMLGRPELRRRIVSWKDSASPWLQRASAVAFVNEAKTGLYNAEILEVCGTTVRNRHRFVQLGTGWVLRELSLADRGLVNGFVREHRRQFIPEGLRYALEKHPADERAALTAL